MNSELFEDVAGQLIGLLNVEIDKRDAQLDDAQKTIRDLRGSISELDSSLWRVQRDLDSTLGEVDRLRCQPDVSVGVDVYGKQIKLNTVLELATEHPGWAREILLLQFPDADVVELLGQIINLMASNKKIDAIRLVRALTPHPLYEDLGEGAYIGLKQAKAFVESYGGEVNLNYLKDTQNESN